MTNHIEEDNTSSTYRIIDANLNRLREGIRVIEDIFRYIYNDKITASKLKETRHNIRINIYHKLLDARDTNNDVLKKTTSSESNRENINQIIISNYKRAQESARVLEEILKLHDNMEAEKFKRIRYKLYDLEKETNKTSNSK